VKRQMMVKETGTKMGTWGKEHRRLSSKTDGCGKSASIRASTHCIHFSILKKMRRITELSCTLFLYDQLQTSRMHRTKID